MHDRWRYGVVDVVDMPLTVGGEDVPRNVVIDRGRDARIPGNGCGPASGRDFRQRTVKYTGKLVHDAGCTVGRHISHIVRVVDEWTGGRSAGEGYFRVDCRVAGSGNSRSSCRGAVPCPRGKFQHVKVGGTGGDIVFAESYLLPVQRKRDQTGDLAATYVVGKHHSWPRCGGTKARSARIGIEAIQPDDVGLVG